MPGAILPMYDIKIGRDSGKIELTLHKVEKIHWWQMCPKLNFQAEQIDQKPVQFRSCQLAKRKSLTHDTDLYVFDLPEFTFMCVPIGHHIYVRMPNG